MKKIIEITCFLYFGSLISCNKKTQSEHKVFIDKDSQGRIVSKSEYYITKNGDSIVDGTVIYYYPNGNIEDSFKMDDGEKNGYYYQYDTSGYLNGKVHYENGKRNSYSYSYYPTGKLEIEELYRNDSILHTRNFFPNGILKSYFIMKNNKESCYYLIKDSMGNIIEDSGDSTKCKR